MKRILSYLAMSLLVGVMAVPASFADGKNVSSHFTLSENLVVGDMLLKKGTYRFKYYGDESALKISKNNGKGVMIIKVKTVSEPSESPYNELNTRDTANGKELVSVKFDHDRRTILLEDESSITSEVEEDF